MPIVLDFVIFGRLPWQSNESSKGPFHIKALKYIIFGNEL